jgi:NAD-dependent deacetylase
MSEIDRLRALIDGATRIVAFTGAGISTESGIPDFRSPGGIWTKYQPIYFDDFMSSEEMRREAWRRKFATDETMTKAEPNAGHRALAKLVEVGRMSAIITQNVDGLHQRSGVPGSKIIELHGNTTYAPVSTAASAMSSSRSGRRSWARAPCRSARNATVS